MDAGTLKHQMPAAHALAKRSGGFTLLEILIVVAIIGIVGSMVALNARSALQRGEERSAIKSFQQSILQGATSASAKGVQTELVYSKGELQIRELVSKKVLSKQDLPEDFYTNLKEGQLLIFTPPGKIDAASLAALPDPVVMKAADKTYQMEISLIGESRLEVYDAQD